MSRPPEPRPFARPIAEQLNDHIQECMNLNREVKDSLNAVTAEVHQTTNALVALKTQHDALASTFENLKKIPMRIVKWVGTIVVGAAIAQGVQSYVQYTETAKKADAATASADKAASAATTSQDVVVHKLNNLGAN